jgi:hypothetical protein
MNQHTKRIILVSIFVGLLIVLLLLMLVFRDKSAEPIEEVVVPITAPDERTLSTISESTVTAPPAIQDAPRDVEPGTADQGIVAKQAARIFVERFATHSNQNNNAHILAVQALVTPSMWSWTQNQGQEQSLREYRGVTTLVIASTLTEFTPDAATVSVEARQVIESEAEIINRDRQGRVVLIRNGNNWLVDAFYWDT